ncbi:MAG: alpha-2-macroglobulin [Desulfobulbus sp.]|jgi:uncharacterized protein YfaS (alpha-2-macroglobulin family)|uniref:alpha-2-macroglobulin n=1 Tax=Desulfobulbus sp. TaxID=895 RepID=UPI00284CDA4A|nr:alpha-2-macroglobulin [Desulfobulbus sp.]MDR2550274.1 alpha-2-macroglobulin [Desulfobulbus sp.]
MKIASFFSAVAGLLRPISHFLAALFGRFDWQPPPWLAWIGRMLVRCGAWFGRNPLAAGILLLAAMATAGGGWYGWQWYSHRPVPHTVAYRVNAPALTRYEQSPIVVAPLRVVFAQSVAPLALVGKPVVTGFRLEPALAGAWRWTDDRTLEFKPEGDWPVGQAYSLSFSRDDFFAPGVLLANYQATFNSAPFTATIAAGELYQDPVDNTLKKLVATVDFSHPVDEASLRRAIGLKLAEGLGFRDRDKEPWTMTVDATGVHAYIHSAPLAVPLESSPVTLVLDKGIGAAKGGSPTDRPSERAVTVPGLYQLAFSGLAVRYVNNQQGEPEQVLMFDSSFPVRDDAIGKKVQAWLLPERGQNRRWTLSTANEEGLKQAQPLALRQIPGAEPMNTHHGFVFRAPADRQIVVKIDEKIEAIGGYLSKKPVTELLYTGEYPKMLKFLGEGALLGLNGEKRVGFLAQGMPGMKVEIARVLPGQLHQIIDQNHSQFAQPSVYGERFDRLVERMEYTRTFTRANESKPLYDFVDIGDYLNADGGRRGVFVLHLTPFDPANPQREYSDSPDGPEEGDRRFILVTDLGLISKRTLDGGREVFVQSIASGAPVAGAKVEIIGRNGLAVAEAHTDEQGQASFPGMDELRREKKPIALVASLHNDLSFLPLGRDEHAVDLSRFDIGGMENAQSPDQVSAALFTDRGLYRPGETVHIGSILRAADWNTRIEDMPVEMEITDPRGSTVWNQRKKCPENGFDGIDFTVGETAPAGSYSVSVYLIKENKRGVWIGGTEFTVGDFEPDRMKVAVSLAEPKPIGWLQPEKVKALVVARHLFGAAASDRRVTGQMRLTPALPAFKQYPGYRFHVEGVLKEGTEDSLPETRTSDTGEAELQLDLERFAQATYRLRLTAQVYEAEGGRNVAAADEALVSSAPYLIGVSSRDALDYVTKGAARSCRWLAVGPDLQPVAVDKLQLALVEYRYLSVLVKQSDGTYKYESRRKEIERDIQPFSLDTTAKDSPLPTTEPGDFAYEIRDAKGTVLNRIKWTVAGAANLSRSLERNAELQIKLDKASYAPGEKIHINLRAPYTGAGLITIERDRVYAHAWFKTTTTSSVQTIVVPKELEGNGYVNVQFVRDPNSPEVFMSPLSSGVAPFAVSLDARTLPLTMTPPEHIEPGNTLRLHLTSKEAARAVVFAVDEGILQVARYKTPNPLGQFFAKRVLDVQTSQILSLILPEYSRLLAAAAPGGGGEDEIGAHLNPFKRKRQPPVAYWSGIVQVPAGGRDFEYTVPEGFNGRLRIVAVAVTPSRIGVFEGATEVRGPWVLTPNVPAFVAPGDEFSISVGAFSNLPRQSQVRVRLETGPGLTVAEPAVQQLEVAPGREGVARFQLRATDRLGSAELAFTAESGEGTAKIHESTSVRPATPYRVALRAGLFTEQALSLARQRDLHNEYRTVEIGYDRSPLVWIQGLTTYLEHYPYSCTEQLISKAMPALILARPEEVVRPDFKPLQAAFAILRQRQSESGGFGQWAGNLAVQPETSIYAIDFLIEARERGVHVPADLERLRRVYLEKIANGPAEGMEELRTKARAIYLLTRQGKVTSGPLAATMEQLERYHRQTWRTDLAAAYLAASQVLLKQQREAEKLMAGVPWSVTAPQTAAAAAVQGGLYGDALCHDAELLTLMARHFPQLLAGIPDTLLPALGDWVSREQYHSLSAALLIRAFDLYGRSIAPQSGQMTVEAGMEQALGPLSLHGQPPKADLVPGWDKVILRKEQAGTPAFYQLTEAGFDRQPPGGELRQGLEILREYIGADGKPLTQVEVGEEFTVRLQLRATAGAANASEIAIVDLLPGGVEPVTVRPKNADEEEQADADPPESDSADQEHGQPSFVDTRDDRVVLYALLTDDVATYTYRVRATNEGVFLVPPPYAEGMYERKLQGRGLGGKLTIVAP